MKRGFSLTELLIVIAVIAILATTGILVFVSAQGKQRNTVRKQDLAVVKTALDTFYSDYSVYPNYSYALATTASPNYGIDLTAKASSCGISPNATYNNGLAPGYVAMRSFVACLGYLGEPPSDPINVNRGTLATDFRYFYFVNYLNNQVKLSAALEGDDTAKQTGDQGLDTARFEIGSGKALVQFCDGFNGNGLCGLDNRTYVYQCATDSAGEALAFVNREQYNPTNANCQSTVAVGVN